jgi:hypothetical protein
LVYNESHAARSRRTEMANRKVELVDDIDEAEEAEEELGPKDISEAVVYGTDWTVETILSQLRRKNIDMPPWQRRDAWTRQRKSRYIESLILGLPVPQIILAERKEKRGTFLVLDGKQRLLLQFIGLDKESDNNRFMLKGLEVLKDLNGQSYESLESDPNTGVILDQFYNEPIRAVIVRNWPSNSFLHLLFVRLNSESLPLSPQELRQALFPGEFVKYVDQASQDSEAIKELLGLEGPDRRMRDIEILVRYIAFAFFLPEHEGNLKKFLDFACKELNKEWGTREEEIRAQMGKFESAVRTGMLVFGEDGFGSRWDPEDGSFTGKLNKAILDVELFYFSDPDVARQASRRKKAVVQAFKKLWVESEEFRNSVESTTKSLGATSTRLSLWGWALKEALGLDFNIPELKDKRIKFSGFWR